MPAVRSAHRDRAIGARLVLARARAGMTRPDLAACTGLSHRQVANYELGRARLPAALLIDLAGALNCSPLALIVTDPGDILCVELLALPADARGRRQVDGAVATLQAMDGRPARPTPGLPS